MRVFNWVTILGVVVFGAIPGTAVAQAQGQIRGRVTDAASALRADEVPTTVLLSPEGRYLLHLSGFVEPRLLRTVLAFVTSGAYRHTSFDEYRAQSTPQCGPSTRR